MSKYMVDETELTGIANAIRAKGKNMYDGDHAYVLEPGYYTFSADVTFDGSKNYWLTLYKSYPSSSGMETASLLPKPSAGTVMRCNFTFNYTSDLVSVSFWTVSELSYDNIQLEKGGTATDYAPHIGLLEFPDGFISAIQGL